MLDLVWHMYLNCSGYSTSSQDFVKALMEKEFPVYIDKNDYLDRYNFAGLSDYYLHMFHTLQYTGNPKNTLAVWNFPPSEFQQEATYNVGYADYEVTKMPTSWVAQCNLMDEIWTSSNFCKEIFANCGVKREIKVIPHTLDPKVWTPFVKPLPIANKREFCFLFASEWMPRKGIYELLEAWFRAFNNQDDVCLILKTYLGAANNIGAIKTEISQVRNNLGLTKDRCAPILLYSDFLKENQMPSLFKCADVLIAPSLGEGFGLSVAQAQMMGIPVVATNWNSLREICNNDIGYMIETDGLEAVSSKQIALIPAYQGAEWAKLNLDSLIDIMRHVYNHPGELRIKSAKCIDFAQKFSYDNISQILIKEINNIFVKYNWGDKEKFFYNPQTGGLCKQQTEVFSKKLNIPASCPFTINDKSFVHIAPYQKYVKVYEDLNKKDFCWGSLNE